MNSLWSVFNYYSYKQQSRHVEKIEKKKSPVEGTDVGAAWRSGSPHSPSSGPAACHACQPAVAAPVRGRRDLVQEHAARWHSEMSRESFPCLSACWKILVQDHAAFRDGQGKLPINMLIYGNLGS